MQRYPAKLFTPNDGSDEVHVAASLHNIKRKFDTVAAPSEAYLEAQIPLSLRITSFESTISLPSAILYLALHPLLTKLDMCIASEGMSRLSPRIVHLITTSAVVIIDHFTQLNENNLIISMWLGAERVLMGGAVWVSGLLHQKHLSGASPQGMLSTGTALSPVMKITSLLASFAARWKAGSAYMTIWNDVVDLLLQVI